MLSRYCQYLESTQFNCTQTEMQRQQFVVLRKGKYYNYFWAMFTDFLESFPGIQDNSTEKVLVNHSSLWDISPWQWHKIQLIKYLLLGGGPTAWDLNQQPWPRGTRGSGLAGDLCCISQSLMSCHLSSCIKPKNNFYKWLVGQKNKSYLLCTNKIVPNPATLTSFNYMTSGCHR